MSSCQGLRYFYFVEQPAQISSNNVWTLQRKVLLFDSNVLLYVRDLGLQLKACVPAGALLL